LASDILRAEIGASEKVGFFASRVFRGAIFSDTEWQKLVASSSNSLPFLTHPRKSLFPPKSSITLKIDSSQCIKIKQFRTLDTNIRNKAR